MRWAYKYYLRVQKDFLVAKTGLFCFKDLDITPDS